MGRRGQEYSKMGAKEPKLSVQAAHRELVAAVKDCADRYRERSGDARLSSPGGGQLGYSYEMERLIAWALTLNDADFDRIQAEGRPVVERLRALPRDYSPRRPEYRDVPPPIEQRSASVFADLPTAVVKPAGRREGRPGKAKGYDVAGGGVGQDAARIGDHGPAHRR